MIWLVTQNHDKIRTMSFVIHCTHPAPVNIKMMLTVIFRSLMSVSFAGTWSTSCCDRSKTPTTTVCIHVLDSRLCTYVSIKGNTKSASVLWYASSNGNLELVLKSRFHFKLRLYVYVDLCHRHSEGSEVFMELALLCLDLIHLSDHICFSNTNPLVVICVIFKLCIECFFSLPLKLFTFRT